MGGWAPLGYEVRDRKLVVNEEDARLVRSIFQRFLKTGSATILARQLIQGLRRYYPSVVVMDPKGEFTLPGAKIYERYRALCAEDYLRTWAGGT